MACDTCGLVQEAPDIPPGSVALCARCDFKLFHRRRNSRWQTFALALAAGILYVPSNMYPLVSGVYLGNHTRLRVWDGIHDLFRQRQYFIAGLVFCTSILTPALKIIGLLFITATLNWTGWRRTRMWIYKVIRVIDPWNMLEVYLLAIGVGMVELGQIATVRPDAGVFSFAAVVVLTLLATLSFDPRLLWDSAEEKRKYE
ncbi:MAG TPA: paraquat-inducible protein A [Verrucomicrobiae bacterium]|nr:paraquat-inducible protein A [Verrucomicrobiae bacterium]